MNKNDPNLGVPLDDLLHIGPVVGDSLRLLGHGGMAYLGIYMGMKEDGFTSALGWSLGVASGFVALLDAISLVEELAIDHVKEEV